jgi:hypothetical protein
MLFGAGTEEYTDTIRKRFLRRRLLKSVTAAAIGDGTAEDRDATDLIESEVPWLKETERRVRARRRLLTATNINITSVPFDRNASFLSEQLRTHKDRLVGLLANTTSHDYLVKLAAEAAERFGEVEQRGAEESDEDRWVRQEEQRQERRRLKQKERRAAARAATKKRRDELEEVDADYSETEVEIAAEYHDVNAEHDMAEGRRQLQLREDGDIAMGDGEPVSRFVRFDADYLAKRKGNNAVVAKRYEEYVRERHFFIRQLSRRRSLFESSSYEEAHACRQLLATFGEKSRSLSVSSGEKSCEGQGNCVTLSNDEDAYDPFMDKLSKRELELRCTDELAIRDEEETLAKEEAFHRQLMQNIKAGEEKLDAINSGLNSVEFAPADRKESEEQSQRHRDDHSRAENQLRRDLVAFKRLLQLELPPPEEEGPRMTQLVGSQVEISAPLGYDFSKDSTGACDGFAFYDTAIPQ